MQQSYDNLRLLLNSRYSCRAYKKQEVSEKDIREIISTASRVPTWCNAQPWEVLVTRGEATEKLSQLLIESTKTQQINPDFNWPTQYVGQYAQRRRQCGYQLYESIGIQKEDKKRRKDDRRF